MITFIKVVAWTTLAIVLTVLLASFVEMYYALWQQCANCN